MPITADLGGKNYTLGRGRVFFDRFAANAIVTATTRGTGERYFGNTTEFNTTSQSDNLDHYDSDSGIKVKDSSVQLTLNRSGAFKCDNINRENMALYFLGDAATITQASATAVVEAIGAVKQGHFYQLGVSESMPAGVKGIANVVVKKGAGFTTTAAQAGNYEVDEVGGRVYIEVGAADIAEATVVQITYDVVANTREQIVGKTDSIYGALRFISDNPSGANRDYYFPYVKLSPDGDYSLKGEQWQEMAFKVEVLKKTSNIQAVYIDGRPSA